jgi:pilus assembly protein Flp/PilA
MNLFVLKSWLQAKFAKDERGASMVEYALLVSLIAVVCIVAVMTLGGNLDRKYDGVGDSIGS